MYLEFWTEFKDYCLEKKTFLRIGKPHPQHWLSMSIGRSQFSLAVTVSTQKRRACCEVYIRGKNAKKAFKLLKAEKTAIEEDTGPLQWMLLPEGQDCRIAMFRPDIDISNRAGRPELYQWLMGKAELFHKTFSSRIKALPDLDTIEEPETESTE